MRFIGKCSNSIYLLSEPLCSLTYCSLKAGRGDNDGSRLAAKTLSEQQESMEGGREKERERGKEGNERVTFPPFLLPFLGRNDRGKAKGNMQGRLTSQKGKERSLSHSCKKEHEENGFLLLFLIPPLLSFSFLFLSLTLVACIPNPSE